MGLSLYDQDLQQSIYNLFSVQCCKISGHRNYINRKQSFQEDLVSKVKRKYASIVLALRVFYLELLLQTYFLCAEERYLDCQGYEKQSGGNHLWCRGAKEKYFTKEMHRLFFLISMPSSNNVRETRKWPCVMQNNKTKQSLT